MRRILAVAVFVVATLAIPTTPSAHALTVVDTVFSATVTVTGGIGDPLTTLEPDPRPRFDCLPLQGDVLTVNCHSVYHHQRQVTVASNICLEMALHPAKNAPLGQAGACSFTGTGFVTGHCGLSGGQLFLTYVDSAGGITVISLHFEDIGPYVLIMGHWSSASLGQHGLIGGMANAVPVPDPSGQRSCAQKTQEDFVIVGKAVLVPWPL